VVVVALGAVEAQLCQRQAVRSGDVEARGIADDEPQAGVGVPEQIGSNAVAVVAVGALRVGIVGISGRGGVVRQAAGLVVAIRRGGDGSRRVLAGAVAELVVAERLGDWRCR
jgi:hypothetical protein